MKKNFTLVSLLFVLSSVLFAEDNVVTLAPSSYVSSPDASTWNFNGGYSITNANSKGYSTGTVNGTSYIKFSKNVVFTINIPSGQAVSGVTFTGYDNYADVDAYVSELNGVTFAETDHVFPKKDAAGVATIVSKQISLSSPASGTLSYTFGGQQIVVQIALSISTPLGTKAVILDNEVPSNVYNVSGQLIKKNVILSQVVDELPNGIYIINNKKVVINK